MALAAKMMQGGLSAGAARAINGDVASAVSAAGTTITDATDLNAGIVVVTTAAASSGVQLPSAEIGDEVEILNLGANAVTVYPDASANRINQLSAGSGFSLATNTAVKVRKFTSTRWMAFLSA
jgi:hypothetical protein